MNKKGFTLIELIVVLAIIGILLAVVLPNFFGEKVYGMELRTYYEANDGNIQMIAKALRNDRPQTVTVLSYAAEWKPGPTVDATIARNRAVQKRLRNLGVYKSQIVVGMANKGGIELDGMTGLAEHTEKAPAKDGVYLYLD